jgi:hypothetical protein
MLMHGGTVGVCVFHHQDEDVVVRVGCFFYFQTT